VLQKPFPLSALAGKTGVTYFSSATFLTAADSCAAMSSQRHSFRDRRTVTMSLLTPCATFRSWRIGLWSKRASALVALIRLASSTS